MAQVKENNSATADRELRLSRLLNAPVALVWEVFINPEHIKNWWGPNGFTNTISKMEVKENGEWDLVMHGPDGTDYKNKSIFREVIKHRKLVYYHVSGPRFLATIEFEAQGDKTLLKWHMLFESNELFEQVVKTFRADVGLKQNVEKLLVYLTRADKSPDAASFAIERTYTAPVAKVWDALTNTNAMKQWYFDIKGFKPEVGCEFQFSGQGKEGESYLHLCKIIELVNEKRLTYSWRYDGYEGISYVTFELFAEGNSTRLILTHSGLNSFPVTINNAFAKENFAEGWTYLTTISLKEFLEK